MTQIDNFAAVKDLVSLRDYLDATLVRKGRDFICPLCGSGTHENGTPAFKIKDDRWKCFSCGTSGDVFDMAGIVNNTDDKAEQLRIVADFAGIVLEGPDGGSAPKPSKYVPLAGIVREDSPSPIGNSGRETVSDAADQRSKTSDMLMKLKVWRDNFAACDDNDAQRYAVQRGFTIAEGIEFGFGYDQVRRRIVLPWLDGSAYHTDRDLTGRREPKYLKPRTEDAGPQPAMWDPSVLETDVFIVVEGVFDAFAIKACGYAVNALAGTSHDKFVAAVVESRYEGVVIVALDNDDKGTEKSGELIAKLHDAGVNAIKACPWENYKDAAELFAADRAALTSNLEKTFGDAGAVLQLRRDEEYLEVLKDLKVQSTADVISGLLDGRDLDRTIPTGISNLDVVMHGGLHAGLTVLAAGSSAGKTTLLNQVADHIAASGRPVLFVTIEQSARELISKSIDRIAYRQNGRVLFMAPDLYDVDARSKFTESQSVALSAAADEYMATVEPWLLYMEGDGRPTVRTVYLAAKEIVKRCGVAPVIIVDYLQLLAPVDERMTDKQATDANVSALRRMARDFSTPVVVISSINRGSYNESIALDSFKESGGVEYSADWALGLQAAGMRDAIRHRDKGVTPEQAAEEHIEANKRADKSLREIVILKSRGYRMPDDPVPLVFDGKSQTFKPYVM